VRLWPAGECPRKAIEKQKLKRLEQAEAKNFRLQNFD
jgi:hypothetical protein